MIPFFVTPTTLQKMELLAAEVLANSLITLKNPKDVLADATKEAFLAVNPKMIQSKFSFSFLNRFNLASL